MSLLESLPLMLHAPRAMTCCRASLLVAGWLSLAGLSLGMAGCGTKAPPGATSQSPPGETRPSAKTAATENVATETAVAETVATETVESETPPHATASPRSAAEGPSQEDVAAAADQPAVRNQPTVRGQPPVRNPQPARNPASSTPKTTAAEHPAKGTPSSKPVVAPGDVAERGPGQKPAERLRRGEDRRPRHDEARLAKAGIRKFASKRLVLYSDVAPELIEGLPGLVDQLYDVLVKYFGELPEAEDKSEFQLTGYLMADQGRYRQLGLLPEDLPGFLHGRHRGLEFWLNDQSAEYYRRHLVLHEATHCFMTAVPNPMQSQYWYMEGMAELFATHAVDDRQRATFAVMPADKSRFVGLGRIRMIEDAVSVDKAKDLAGVFQLQAEEYIANEPYAWSWAACYFLTFHPRYQERFRTIEQQVTHRNARAEMLQLFAKDWLDLQEEWQLFVRNLGHGYDLERAAITFERGEPPTVAERERQREIRADRGWQSSRVWVEAGRSYEVTATGRYSVAQQPKPWICEPQGVSIRYCQSRPLGMLVGTIRSEPALAARAAEVTPSLTRTPRTTMHDVLPLGRSHRFQAAHTGTLYLRINEFWNELADNQGTLQVRVRLVTE